MSRRLFGLFRRLGLLAQRRGGDEGGEIDGLMHGDDLQGLLMNL